MEPPPRKKDRGEHHGIGLGVVLGALAGLLIGAIALLAFTVSRNDTLDEIKNSLDNQESQVKEAEAVSNVTTETSIEPINDEPLGRPEVIPMNDIAESSLLAAPHIISTNPDQDASEVPWTSSIKLVFNSKMDEDTLTDSDILVFEDGKNISHQLSYEYDASAYELTISLTSKKPAFKKSANIEVRVGSTVASEAGATIDKPFVLEFETR